MFPAAERSMFFPLRRVCGCGCVILYVCVYFISSPAADEITSMLYSVAAIRQEKCNVDKPGTQTHISADEIIPP